MKLLYTDANLEIPRQNLETQWQTREGHTHNAASTSRLKACSLTNGLADDIPIRNRYSALNIVSDESEREEIIEVERPPPPPVTKQKKPKKVKEANNARDKATTRIPTITKSQSEEHAKDTQERLAEKKQRITKTTDNYAKTQDVKHYTKPTLATKPDAVIIQWGTNDIKNIMPEKVSESMLDLGKDIKQDCGNAELIFSTIITRTDVLSLNAKTNSLLDKICS
ncbi:Scavenger receptor cysteine-rich type 1 M130 [Paramuricea clavata]|uniref:Scavenger receptor cysteine-rich type 1 M130 n=1 Tax=Paramuricea clavata TaxID=317549 RepID=A0A7D9LZH1_PARCT|nr:Scavenger receptor cysteine-rich type 1 M130 [Paramuricea clavata]